MLYIEFFSELGLRNLKLRAILDAILKFHPWVGLDVKILDTFKLFGKVWLKILQ